MTNAGYKSTLTTVYIEVNSALLSNAGCYYLEDNYVNTLFDIAIIFAANINGSAEKSELYLNENVMKTLNNAENQIRPLQGRGIKVLLSIVGNHQTAGISNFQSEEKAMNFANQVKNIVEKYGLDGVDLDDEYTDYRGSPSRDDSVRWLISCLRNIMPNKIISLYAIGPAADSMRTAPPDIGAKLNYAWNHDYGSYNPPQIPGLGKRQLAAAAIELGKTQSYKIEELAEKTKNDGYGVFLTYNLKGGDQSKDLSLFADILYQRKIYYKDEKFTSGIDAITPTGTSGQYWMFKGDRYIRYSTDREKIQFDNTIYDGWPGLRGTEYANGIDAITKTGTSGQYWMFKGNRYIRYSTDHEKIQFNNTIYDGWPGLRGTPYANGIDAITPTGTSGEYWMFKGARYIRYSTDRETIQFDNTIFDGWPGLRGTPYADGIDAITPTGTSGEYWMFKGDRYIRYSTDREKIQFNNTIYDGWPGLR